jgi:2-phospho-L-lactate guanylyltransferase
VIPIAAIIPVGTLAGAKTRLGETLDAEERLDLVDRLLAQTVVAALAVRGITDVLVVSPDREVLRRAAELGARTLRQRSRGLNAGLSEARADATAGGAQALLVLPIDLPLVTPETIAQVIEPLAASDRSVALVPDRHGTGTNALGLRPPDVIDFAFGPRSHDAHRAAAGAAGARYVELGGPLAVDLDTPDDYVHVQSLVGEDVRAG